MSDFINDLKGIKEDDNYKKAINGETKSNVSMIG